MTNITSTISREGEESSREIYSDPEARQVLQFLLKNITTAISPQTLATDEVIYPQLQSIFGEHTDAERILTRMASSGVITESLADKVPACPECNSKQISTRYLCPQCYSFDVTRSFLFEHLKCGKVASDESFKKGDEYVCPKCQTVLHNFGVEFRAIGAWYKCNHCNNSFNAALQSLFCRQKHHQFTPERARLLPIYEYRINTSILNEIRNQVCVYGDLISYLEDAGLTVLAPHALPGKSGDLKSFDLVITSKARWGGQRTIAMDVTVSESENGPDVVREFAAKVRDTKPTASYLVAIPELSNAAKDLAKSLRISVVEASSLKEAVSQVQSLPTIKELIS